MLRQSQRSKKEINYSLNKRWVQAKKIAKQALENVKEQLVNCGLEDDKEEEN